MAAHQDAVFAPESLRESSAPATDPVRVVRAQFVPVVRPGDSVGLTPTQVQPDQPSVPALARLMADSATVPAAARTGGSTNWGIPGGRSAEEWR